MSEPAATASRLDGYRHRVEVGEHELVVDEPPASGGDDAGPSPTRLLAASLASCTAITVEMYASRKGWELPELRVSVEVEGSPVKGDAAYNVVIHLPGGLSEEQTQKLTAIAARCPVHRALQGESEISITNRAEVRR